MPLAERPHNGFFANLLMPTVVFTDVVGSTSLFEQLGDEAASLLITRLTGVLSQVFEQHGGRVVKLLGDGIFVVFPVESNAVSACISLQARFHADPIYPPGSGSRVQVQMGISSGELVEIDGDCFGDAVNSAARLADLAGADQILTTQVVWDALVPIQRSSLRSLGEIHLRGKADHTHVYRVEWQDGVDVDATTMGSASKLPRKQLHLDLTVAGMTKRFDQGDDGLTIGRAPSASLMVTDPRVSRVHATIKARGGQLVLADNSSFGTWVYFGNQHEAVALRRTECYLVGSGEIVLGCERNAENAPVVAFSVRPA